MDQPPGDRAPGVGQVLGGLAGIYMEGQFGACPRQVGDGQVRAFLALGGLGELRELGAAHGQRGNVPPLCPSGWGWPGRFLHQALLDVQEPQLDLHARPGDAFRQDLGLRRGRLVGVHVRVRGRHQHAELEPGLVLPRGLPVGVQQVALVQDRVGHGAGVREVVR